MPRSLSKIIVDLTKTVTRLNDICSEFEDASLGLEFLEEEAKRLATIKKVLSPQPEDSETPDLAPRFKPKSKKGGKRKKIDLDAVPEEKNAVPKLETSKQSDIEPDS